MGVKHKFFSTKLDGPDALKVQKTNWNDDHLIDILTGAAGSGIDGALHFDGVATPADSTLAGSTYTLTRCIFPSAMIVDVGISIDMANSRILVAGTLTNNGHIHNDGANAVTTVGGASKAAAFFAATCGGGAGAGPASGSGTSGQSSTLVPPIPFSQGSASAANGGEYPGTGVTPTIRFAGGGGGGTTYALGLGGNGGAVTAAAASKMPTLEDFIAGRDPSRASQWTGGGGGGGGGAVLSGGPGGTAGSGGAGGGVAAVVCGLLDGTGTITCKGGNGSNAGVPASGAASYGGGGGGAGGLLIVAYSSNIGPNTFSVANGTGGTRSDSTTGGVGFGAADPGGAGAPGLIVRINLNNDGT